MVIQGRGRSGGPVPSTAQGEAAATAASDSEPTPHAPASTRHLEGGFERVLWGSRLLVVGAVVVILLLAVAALVLATVDAVWLLRLLTDYANPLLAAEARDTLRTEVVTTIVKSLDGYLIAALLVIVAFGLYELFVNRIDPAHGSAAARRLLQIRDLEDLKQRVAKLVVLVLVVEFFQQALKVPVGGSLELLWLGLGILVVSAALWLTGQHRSSG